MNNHFSTRRQFIKTAVVAAAGAPFFHGPATRAFAAEPGRKLGFALVGLGNLSTNQIAPALQKTTNCRLAAIVTGHPVKAERWKAKYGLADKNIYNYDNMDTMAGNPEIDVVYVVTPNALHAEHTIKAAQAGKHVLCEKPMEVSSAKCQAMIEASKKAGRQLAIGYRCQFEPHHLECARLAREKVLGSVKSIAAGFGFTIGDPTQWRLNRALSGGGPLMDVGIYALQTSRFITGAEPASVTAKEGAKTEPDKFKEGVEESLTWQLKFPGGIIAGGSTAYKVEGPMNHFAVYADEGSFGMDPAYSYADNRGFRSDGKDLRFDAVDQFAVEMDNFAECIRSGRPSKVSGEEGLRDLRIMTAIYEAARTGKEVTLG